jgi:hypothetical protein
MSTFLTTSVAPEVNLYILRRDSFDGLSLLLQDEDGAPLNLTDAIICSTIWKNDINGGLEQVVALNATVVEPANAGRIRLWLSGPQTAAVWDAAQFALPSNIFSPTAHASQARPFLSWDVRVETQELASDLISVSAGVFTTQLTHGLAPSDRVIFKGTNQSSINYNGTSSKIYKTLTDLSYLPPYSFTVPALSGITDSGIGGAAYRLKQDTVVAGAVIVGTTLSNCFP